MGDAAPDAPAVLPASAAVASPAVRANRTDSPRSRREKKEQATVAIKSKYNGEWRRYSIERRHAMHFADLYDNVRRMHEIPSDHAYVGNNSGSSALGAIRAPRFRLMYIDSDQNVVPVDNDADLAGATAHMVPVFHVSLEERKKRTFSLPAALLGDRKERRRSDDRTAVIGTPHQFRMVSRVLETYGEMRKLQLTRQPGEPLGMFVAQGNERLGRKDGLFVSVVQPGSVAATAFQAGDELLEANGRDLRAMSAVEAMGVLGDGDVLHVTVRSPLSAVEQHRQLHGGRVAGFDATKREDRRRISSPVQLLRAMRGKSSNSILSRESRASEPAVTAPKFLREKSLSSSGLPLTKVERMRASGEDAEGVPDGAGSVRGVVSHPPGATGAGEGKFSTLRDSIDSLVQGGNGDASEGSGEEEADPADWTPERGRTLSTSLGARMSFLENW